MVHVIDYFPQKLTHKLGETLLRSIEDIHIAYQDYNMNPFLDIDKIWLIEVCNQFGYTFTMDESISKTTYDIGLTWPVERTLFDMWEI